MHLALVENSPAERLEFRPTSLPLQLGFSLAPGHLAGSERLPWHGQGSGCMRAPLDVL